MKKVIGVTGGFGVGKSTFCRMMAKHGGHFLEADLFVHALYEPGKSGYQKIRGYFGEEFVDSKKGVNRAKLRREVLKNPQKLWILHKLIHPLVTHEAQKKLKTISAGLVFLEAFYFEKDDLGKLIDILVEIRRKPALVRKSRLKEDKWPLEDIERFMRLSPIIPKPDFVIENNGTLKELARKTAEMAKSFFGKTKA